VLSTGGTLTVSDFDSPRTFVAQAGTVGLYGTFGIGMDGTWTYATDSAHNEFVAGRTYTDTFSVSSADGTTTSVTVDILGTNDAAVISGTSSGAVLEAGGINNTTLGSPTASGTLADTDIDNPANLFTAVGTPVAITGGYGSYTMTSAGVWTYYLDNNNPTVQALNIGGTLTDTFTVTTIDGTAKLVTVTIGGANDAAVVSAATVNLTETDAALSTGGMLAISDIDNPATFVAQAHSVGLYGTFTLATDGTWTYLASSAHDEFVAGQTYTDSFAVQSADGVTSSVTVKILGTNDAASISGTSTGSVLEARRDR